MGGTLQYHYKSSFAKMQKQSGIQTQRNANECLKYMYNKHRNISFKPQGGHLV
jgi:hypothetical protein